VPCGEDLKSPPERLLFAEHVPYPTCLASLLASVISFKAHMERVNSVQSIIHFSLTYLSPLSTPGADLGGGD
jgi:hypothetical protein